MSETDLVVAATAADPFEAQVKAAVLRSAEIPVYVGGRMLTDEFAMSQALMGLSRVDLFVRPEDLKRAEKALAEAAESASALDDENFDPGERVE